MATHCSILAWEIPWTEEPGGVLQPWSCKRVTQQLCLKSLQHTPSLPTLAADHSYFSFLTSTTRQATQWQITDQACPVSKAGLLSTLLSCLQPRGVTSID